MHSLPKRCVVRLRITHARFFNFLSKILVGGARRRQHIDEEKEVKFVTNFEIRAPVSE